MRQKKIQEIISNWILNNSNKLTVDKAIAPMTGELFVPFKYNYPEILRTWLEIHAEAQKERNDEAMLLIEQMIETTITQEYDTGTLLLDSD